MTLHLVVPPTSMYQPGVLCSHVCGNMYLVFCLNSDEEDMTSDIVQLFTLSKLSEHQTELLKPLFFKAIENTKRFIAKRTTYHI
jgi:hypothetical protein